ncbi:hypothetical protein [Ilumatobacter sp.]|uniref:hypothetical protein n=1 Tax=Ilumatobacter sp. TaxID=1967498 RepID=UPI003C3FF70A
MKQLFRQLTGNGRQIAAWYASPTGLVSALALLVVLALATAGRAGAAVWVLVSWLAVLLPYKFARERAERTKEAARVARQLRRVEADLAATPTIAELTEWQEAVERQSTGLLAKVASLDQLRESLRLQREIAAGRPSDHGPTDAPEQLS